MFGDFFEGGVEKTRRDFTFGSSSNGEECYTVSVMCVHGENQHIDKWVPLVVWRAAEAFGEEITSPRRKHELVNKRVIELGSGTGLCGLLAAKISGQFTLLTDGNDDSLEALEESIEMNKDEDGAAAMEMVKSHVCEWGNMKHVEEITQNYGGAFDVCIATDVIYDKEAIHPLLRTALAVLPNDQGTFILANHRYRYLGLVDEVRRVLTVEPRLLLEELVRIGNDDVDLFVFRKI